MVATPPCPSATAHRAGVAVRLAVAAAVLLLAALVASPAAGAAPSRTGAMRLVVAAKPAVLVAATPVTVRGSVAGRLTGRRSRLRVELQTATGRRFRTVRRSGVNRSRRFTLSWTSPSRPGAVRLRLRLRRGNRTLRVSRPWLAQVRVPAPAPRPAPGPTPVAPPAAPAAPAAPVTRTFVLAPATISSVPAPGEAGDVRLSGPSDLRAGDVVAAGIGDATPFGFLGKVVAVRQEGPTTVVGTVPTTLVDALPEGDIDQRFVLEELEGGREDGARRREEQRPSSSPGSSSRAERRAPVIRQRVSTLFTCQGGASVTVKGVVGLSTEVDLDASWRPFRGVSARLVGSATASSELSASAEASASCSTGKRVLFTRMLKPISFSVGPVPVVIVPKVTVYLSAEGRVEASVRSEVHGSLTASAGIEYANGEAKPVSSFTKDFGYTPPDPSGSARLEATASPTLDLLVYGVAGPEIAFNAGLRVDADPEADPRWTLKAPVSLTAKLAVPVLKISTGTLTVFEREYLLAQEGETNPTGVITFDEFPRGTVITDQYADRGVLFDGDVYLENDGAQPATPVLSGTPRFQGPIAGRFVVPGTSTPATVDRLQLDAGYIDSPGSVEIVATLTSGRTIRALADQEGIDRIFIAARGIRSFVARTVADEPSGFTIDNLEFGGG